MNPKPSSTVENTRRARRCAGAAPARGLTQWSVRGATPLALSRSIVLSPLILGGDLATCSLVELEILYSTRGSAQDVHSGELGARFNWLSGPRRSASPTE